MATTISADEWAGRLDWAIQVALAQAGGEFKAGVVGAYARTRFAPSFRGELGITPASGVRAVSLISTNPLLQVVEYPTRPHPIDARRGPNLYFYWVKRGRWFLGPHVNHPGTAGKGYIAPRHEAASARFGAVLAAEIAGWNA